ncbi:MAG: peptidoglycan bridge formation glycyltransferase FemA/FemB family protein [Candidatus Saccharibacteria bacterium]|nr:peptidoglycan bridge formation glycyltransferase FemA/FemB family protein [Candidatus Saccharibacteria bacterium]
MPQSKIRLKTGWQTIESKPIWQKFLQDNPQLEINLTNNFNWGICHQKLGQTVHVRVYVDSKGQLTAGYIAVLEIAKAYSFLAITSGPLLDWSNQRIIKSFVSDAKKIAQKHKCHFVRIRPIIEDNPKIRQALEAVGFTKAPMHLAVEVTGFLDLSLDDQTLRKNMSPSLKRKINKARRDDKIEIKISDSKKDADIFAQVHQEHALMKNYKPFSKARIIRQFETYVKDNQVLIYMAFRDGQLLAANMMFFCGQEASYYWGVSTELGHQYSSAPLLHLEAIAEAKKRNLQSYNFWGIVGVDQVKHRYFGLSQFKRSFGVIERVYVPTHDLPVKKGAYVLIKLFETLRHRRRHL